MISYEVVALASVILFNQHTLKYLYYYVYKRYKVERDWLYRFFVAAAKLCYKKKHFLTLCLYWQGIFIILPNLLFTCRPWASLT